MKHIITLLFFSLFVSCIGRGVNCAKEDRGALDSTIDLRCQNIKREARKHGVKIRVCYEGPLTVGLHKTAKHPDPKACKNLIKEAYQKCKVLPYDPNNEPRVPKCEKIYAIAEKTGKDIGICYNGPLVFGLDKEAKHPDPEKCNTLWFTARKQCHSLPASKSLPENNALVCF